MVFLPYTFIEYYILRWIIIFKINDEKMSSVLNDHSYCIISESDSTSLNNSLSTVEKIINSFDEDLFYQPLLLNNHHRLKKL